MMRPKYNFETGEFLGQYVTAGFLVDRGDAEEIGFNYGFDKENSKVLYSHYRRKISDPICETMFNCHRTMTESEKLGTEI